MNYITSNIPYFKAWVRREYTTNFDRYHGEFLHAMVIAVTTLPMKTLSFQVLFTGCDEEENVHGGAMWARMPLTALVGPRSKNGPLMPTYLAQPWDCQSHHHSVFVLNRATPCPWLAKIDGISFQKYYHDYYTDTEVADDPAQHKQSHVLELMDAGEWTGNIVALPNNRVRVTNPAWFVTGDGPPDFTPSQWVHHSKQDPNYVEDTARVFNNLYAESDNEEDDDEE